ncbi:MAG: HpcH/HpaI aldolase family protein [Anaerolineae bacterium]|jgi:4-hydroxy-2-oxoheptanedioate aldolase|nr:aldolase [Chloroflexota bacterium]
MRKNSLKEKLQRGETVVGPFINCVWPAFTEIIGLAGFDFAIIDTEHGPLSIETAEDLCRAGQLAGLDPIVRVSGNEQPLIQRALDIGSAGVQVPQIETREQAEAVVRAAKYAPLGMRGISLFTRAGDYTVYGTEGLTDGLNDEQVVIIHIEGVRGLENLEEIITVPNIDVVFLGPYDLSQSYGIPGQVNDPRVVKGMEEAIAKIRAAGKAVGTFAADTATARRWMDAGVQYMSLGVDVGIFANACRQLVKETKGITPERVW